MTTPKDNRKRTRYIKDWTFAAPKNVVDPHPSLRATLSHKERENNQWGCGSNRRFMPRPCHCVMKRLFVPLKSALSSVNHSLALGERVAAGRVRVNPRELLPKNVQTPGQEVESRMQTDLMRLY